MRRHETDWLSLTVGGLFVVVAAVHLGTEGTGDAAGLRWFIPAVLVVLGTLGLVGALRGREPAAVTTPAVERVAPPEQDHDLGPSDDTVTTSGARSDSGSDTGPDTTGDGPDTTGDGPGTTGDGTEDTLRL